MGSLDTYRRDSRLSRSATSTCASRAAFNTASDVRHACRVPQRRSRFGQYLQHAERLHPTTTRIRRVYIAGSGGDRSRELTLNLGLRFETNYGWQPATCQPQTAFVQAQCFPEIQGAPDWKALGAAVLGGLRPLRRRQDGAQGGGEPVPYSARGEPRRAAQPVSWSRATRMRGATPTETASRS